MGQETHKKEQRYGAFGNWCYAWMYGPVSKARKGELGLEDLYLPPEDHSKTAYEQFLGNWEEQMKKPKPSLLRAIIATYFWPYLVAGLFKLCWGTFVIMGAFYFVRALLTYVTPADRVNSVSIIGLDINNAWSGWILASFFFLDAFLLGQSLQRMVYGSMRCAIKARGALVNAVCQKSFRMSSINKDEASDVVTFVATDIAKIYDGMLEFHYLWTAPFEAIAILGLLASLTGQNMLPGLGVMLMVVPAQYFFGLKIIKFKKLNSKAVNERGSILQEVLPAIKLVKYYAWEQFFEDEVARVRKEELHCIYWMAVYKVINVAMVFCVPPLTAFAIFITYQYQTGALPTTMAFTTLSLFNILRFPLVVLPKALRAVSEASTSMERVEAFLVKSDTSRTNAVTESPTIGVTVRDGVFQHTTSNPFTLRVPNFNVQRGEVVAVVGKVGAGKSSLVHAILGNMDKQQGSISVGGRISYVPQNPWCQNLSVRDNILFGDAFNASKYDDVIHACALTLDLEILQNGDKAMAGIRGVNLSGGQRQRVNLARCAYADSDLVLLDNALSAVDHHTAHHIFDHCIKGLFARKATILITHQVEFLPRCDKVAIMNDGDCTYFGPWNAEAQDILGRLLPIQHLLHAAGQAEERREPAKKKKENKKLDNQGSSTLNMQPTMMPTDDMKKNEPVHKLTAGQAMMLYIKAGGLWLLPIVIFFFLMAQATRQLSDFWVRWWSNDSWGWYSYPPAPPGVEICTASGNPPVITCRTSGTYNGIKFNFGTYDKRNPFANATYSLTYMGLMLTFWVFMMFRGATFLWMVLRAAQRFHSNMVHRILFAPLGFFFGTPVGDLLLSFSYDQAVLDEQLPDSLHFLGIYGLIVVSTTITVSITINPFAAFIGALVIVTVLMVWLYMPAATSLKRLRTDTAGRVVSLVAEVLEGLNVVQAYAKQQYFVDEAAKKLDDSHTAVFNQETLNLWLAFYCDLVGALLVYAVALFAVGMAETLGAGTVGLAFSNIIQLLVFYTWVVRFMAEAISLFAAAENVAWLATYTPIDGENTKKAKAALPKPGSDLEGGKGAVSTGEIIIRADAAGNQAGSWPRVGEIVFEDVWMQYRSGAPWALKGVTFHIRGQEKVGFVGRTGSGKSTTLLALFRMFDLGRGHILVDGVDISTLPLKKLRTGLSIIPQEPVMFSGTVRSNLDPWRKFSDAELWEVLERVGLKAHARDSAGGLDGRVDGTGGAAWSLGQQQLVCLARAALRKVPVLCLDEATAAMDPATEAVVQDTIKRMFSDRTTLTIAHRLDTVIETDKIVVLEQGVLKEFDSPHALLSNPESMFSKLVDKSGASAAAALRQMASEYFATKQQRL